MQSESFNHLLEEELTGGRSISVGQVVDGTVVQINEDGVFVDIGAKSEGHLELDQISEDELRKLQKGDKIKVKIVRHSDGEFKLSKKSVDYDEAWNRLQDDFTNGVEIDIVVTEKVKNGYMANAYGVLPGFIHHTNFKGRPTPGQAYKGSILDFNRKARKLVFTRRDIMLREETEALERDYGQLLEGMVVEGVVERLSPYGAFVKITNNVTGLLHISEFSFDHVKKPSEVLKPGDVVQVKILTIDKENNRVSLSRKATLKDPLMLMLPGEELDGTVESVADFGVFVRMENGVTGLVHVSEMSHQRFGHPAEIMKPGDTMRVKVLRVQPEDRRVSLSAKATERDPWSEVFSHYSQGQAISGTVTQVLESGAVVQLDQTFEAFVPVSEMSEERINHPSDLLTEGQEVSGVVLSIDSAKRRIRMSLKRTEESMAQERPSAPRQQDTSMISDIRATAGKVTLGDILKGKLDLTGQTAGEKSSQSAAKAQAEAEAAAEAAAAAAKAAEKPVAGAEPEASTTPEDTSAPADEAPEAADEAVEAEAVAPEETVETANETEPESVEPTPADTHEDEPAAPGSEPLSSDTDAPASADEESTGDSESGASDAADNIAQTTEGGEGSDSIGSAAETTDERP